ncbi:MAG: hypothetical protein ACYSVY_05775 [Planctomycetota bacterium]
MNEVPSRIGTVVGLGVLLLLPHGAGAQSGPSDGHATYENLLAAMQSQFTGLFTADNRGADGDHAANGISTPGIPGCARIHPLDASDSNLAGDIPSFCEEDAHAFYDWLCFFDTTHSLANTWPERVTRREAGDAKSVTGVRMWLGGPFVDPPADVAGFVLNPEGYPAHEPTEELEVWSGALRKFNGGIVLQHFPELYQALFDHAFTYPNGVIFDQLELESPYYYTLRLRICSSSPIRPGSPTKGSSLGGWVDVRAETEQTCWWDRTMVIQAKKHTESPDLCCGRDAE